MRYPGLAILSGAGLLLEIALTQLLSTIYFPPYVFAVLSLAILGVGLGAGLAAWKPILRQPERLAIYASLAAISTLLMVSYAIFTAPFAIQLTLFLLIPLPYLFLGLAISTIFSVQPERSTTLYMADLVGAGLGTILAIPVMMLVNPINAALIAAVGFALSAPLLVTSQRVLSAAALILTLLFAGGNLALDFLQIDFASLPTEKPLTTALNQGGEILETRWDAFARTDLVAPGDDGPYQIYVDGAAGSIMPPVENSGFLIRDIGFFPFATSQPETALVIGPGGGLDVWFGLNANAQRIIGVEVNPASVELVREYADYNGGLYDLPLVNIVVDEGRSALRRDNRRYDLIFLSQVITETAERGGYALTENTIYTVEAFQDYLDHLTSDGQIALKLYDEPTLTRALSVAVAALKSRGLDDEAAFNRIAAFIDPNQTPPVPLLLINNQRFAENDALVLGAVAREVGFEPLYLPDVLAQPPLDTIANGEAIYADIVAASSINITATSDDRPYFFQFERGLPRNLTLLVGLVILINIAAIALIIYAQRGEANPILRGSFLYFALLGVGFITLEIAVIQKLSLFLGHPTLAVTAVIATFLIGGGMGSLLAGQSLKLEPLRVPPLLPAAVVIAALGWWVIWDNLSDQLIPLEISLRLIAAVLVLLPLTLLMGMLLPVGLQALREVPSQYITAAWAINGLTTVLGSVLAVALSILVGFNSVLVLGIVCYLLLVPLLLLTHKTMNR